ncbi:MAG: cation:proton antiporter [archaeon]
METAVMQSVVIASFGIVVIGTLLRLLNQPHVVAYILAGALMGPFGLGLVRETQTFQQLGEVGVILLLFFAGTEVSLPKLMSNWRVAIFGTGLQVLFSIIVMAFLGIYLKLSLPAIILFGFIISLSSTAVVLRILDDWKEMDTRVGQNVVGILLIQDVGVVFMLIVLGFFGEPKPALGTVALQFAGGALIAGFVCWLLKRKAPIQLPFHSFLRKDSELQVFVAMLLCLGFATATSFFGISPALGAFVAGLFVSSMRESSLAQATLKSFRIVFVALFFVSVGFLLDFGLVARNFWQVFLLVAAVFLANTAINAAILLYLGDNLRESLYAGALLAQIGEFSFILGAVGFSRGILSEGMYGLIVAVTAITLLLSPFWVLLFKKCLGIRKGYCWEPLAGRGKWV